MLIMMTLLLLLLIFLEFKIQLLFILILMIISAVYIKLKSENPAKKMIGFVYILDKKKEAD